MKKKSEKLRTLLAQQFGTDVGCLSNVLGNEDQKKDFKSNREDKVDQKKINHDHVKSYNENDDNLNNKLTDHDNSLNDEQRKTYTDSSFFLKGESL